MSGYFNAPSELKHLPTTRAAYSDRSAWMMSEMSALAYLSFEGDNRFKGLLRTIAKTAAFASQRGSGAEIADQFQALEKTLKDYIDHRLGSHDDEPPALREPLNNLPCTCLKCFGLREVNHLPSTPEP